ncbi:TPA_asm: hypothetical protein vir519_00043 [Caudoviricetes sp. vir519]|nr:TPA_asm: hypothetical protein vir519_00043 [Caudoviricetes sp. vir519]
MKEQTIKTYDCETGKLHEVRRVKGKIFPKQSKKKKVKCSDCPSRMLKLAAWKEGLISDAQYNDDEWVGYCTIRRYPVTDKPKFCNSFGKKRNMQANIADWLPP